MTLSAAQLQKMQDELIAWYRRSHRDLPWRNTHDAYAIWLSEIMLQQTQVATVLPYYGRFLTLFPTVNDLANASLDEVLKAWEGLGYYSRARNLYKAAQHIRDHHQGIFPNTLDAVQALCGIGQSTAGAILTFAFKQPHPILDGNVKRVLSRAFAVESIVQEAQTIATLWDYSTQLLPENPDDAYDYNQAIMELGASLCSRTNPQCEQCPWVTICQGKAKGIQKELPRNKPKKATPHYTIGVGVVWKDDKVLISLRPEEGLLGGLWEFPGGKCEPNELITDCVIREIKEETGLVVTIENKLAEVKHAYSHFKITLHAYECHYISGEAEPNASQQLKWVSLEDIEQYAFPKANKTVLEALLKKPDRQLTLC